MPVDGESTVNVGDMPVRIIHTPGHTPGSLCFLAGEKLISGDTLFIGSCGRVDLPGSNPEDLYYSLNDKLKNLPEETVLYPGHNYSSESESTIGPRKTHECVHAFHQCRGLSPHDGLRLTFAPGVWHAPIRGCAPTPPSA